MEKRAPEESQQKQAKVVKLIPRGERRQSKEWQRQRDQVVSRISNLYYGIEGIIKLIDRTSASAERMLTLIRAERDAQQVAGPNLEKQVIRLKRLLETRRAVESEFFDGLLDIDDASFRVFLCSELPPEE